MSFLWEPKDPDEVYEYQHDWGPRLLVHGVDAGDTIRLSNDPDATKRPSILVESGDVVLDAIVVVPGTAKIKYWLSGGTVKSKMVATIWTAQGRSYQESFVLPIKER